VLDSVALNGEEGSGVGEWGSAWAAGFCGPCVYLDVFLL
jgi:hypothetical protein